MCTNAYTLWTKSITCTHTPWTKSILEIRHATGLIIMIANMQNVSYCTLLVISSMLLIVLLYMYVGQYTWPVCDDQGVYKAA